MRNRGFVRNEFSADRDARIQEMKQRMACAACRSHGKIVFGHWHSDPSCPYRDVPPPKASNKDKDEKPAKSAFVVNVEEASESEGSEAAFAVMAVHRGSANEAFSMVLATSSSTTLRQSTRALALSDTCCARTVCGESWAKAHADDLHAKGVPFVIVPDHQPYRFGDGPRVKALYAMVFPIYLDGDHYALLCTSVVIDDVPLLISASALKSWTLYWILEGKGMCSGRWALRHLWSR